VTKLEEDMDTGINQAEELESITTTVEPLTSSAEHNYYLDIWERNCLVRRACEKDVSLISAFEASLFPIIQDILAKEGENKKLLVEEPRNAGYRGGYGVSYRHFCPASQSLEKKKMRILCVNHAIYYPKADFESRLDARREQPKLIAMGMMAILGYIAGVASDALIKKGHQPITFVRTIMQTRPSLCLNYVKTPAWAAVLYTAALSFSSFNQAGFLLSMQLSRGITVINQYLLLCFIDLMGKTPPSRTELKREKSFHRQSEVPVNLVCHTVYQCNLERLFQCHLQRFSAITSYHGSIEKPLSNHFRSFSRRLRSALEHEYISHSEAIDTSKTSIIQQLNAFYRFSRPHTIIGTVVGIISVSLLPVETVRDLSLTFFVGLLKALVPALLMNVYVVGLNQLYDVNIDKVNKPDLPLASGEFSMEVGATIVATFSFLSFAMGLSFQSPPLLYALLISFLLGSAYSVDKYVLGKPIVFTRSLVFATVFMCFFSAVIALFKDIPDVDGDQHFGIQSFSVQLGQETVFRLCINLLLMAYGIAVVIGASSPYTFNKFVTVLGHCTLASMLWLRARSTDLTNKASITAFYMFIWKVSLKAFFVY
ncbi:hypothetical protein IFM89_004327, partial [Coptis chinensis]